MAKGKVRKKKLYFSRLPRAILTSAKVIIAQDKAKNSIGDDGGSAPFFRATKQ